MKKIMIFLAAASIALCGALFAGCDGGNDGHTHEYGEWTVAVQPNCENAGSQYRACTICGEKEEKTVPALGHDWSLGTVTKAAKCEEVGARLQSCRRCNKDRTVEIAPLGHDWDWANGEVETPATCEEAGVGSFACLRCGKSQENVAIPALGHSWGAARPTKSATCEEAGERVKECTVCGKEEKETVPALGHSWVAGAVIREASCTEAGLQSRTCSVCGKTGEGEIEPLGHNWQGDYTIDIKPTFETDGEKSYHCTRCDARTGVTKVDKLDEDIPIDYEFCLLRNNGTAVIDPQITVEVFDGDERVAVSGRGTLSGGRFVANLLPKVYTVKVKNLPEGYSAEQSYTAAPDDPLCKIYLSASPIASAAPQGTKYDVGDVVHDFTVTTVEGKSLTLSEILGKKKAVVLNFWYTGCVWCKEEFPGLERAYKTYQEDVEVIAIDPAAQGDSEVGARAFAQQYGLTFPVVLDRESKIHNYFSVTGYPVTVVIDREGVVAEIHRGGLVEGTAGNYDSERLFSDLFKKYISDSYWKNTANTPLDVLLSGEYLPVGKH